MKLNAIIVVNWDIIVTSALKGILVRKKTLIVKTRLRKVKLTKSREKRDRIR